MTNGIENFKALQNKLAQMAQEDPLVRAALRESRLRRELAVALEEARKHGGLSIRDLAKKMSTSVSQVQRLVKLDYSGGVTLKTILRAAETLHVPVNITVNSYESCPPMTTGGWERTQIQAWRRDSIGPPCCMTGTGGYLSVLNGGSACQDGLRRAQSNA